MVNKVKVGFFSFTEITDPAEHHSYNEWHQLDHMPEQYPLAGLAFGQRWVSTRACRAARAVDGALLAGFHYVTLYLMTEPLDDTLEQFRTLGGRLRELGRFHEHRRALLSGPFSVETVAAAPRVLISAEAVPYRPNRGAYVIVQEADGEPVATAAFLAHPAVAGVWSFVADAEGPGPWRPGQRRVTVCFLDGAPVEAAVGLGQIVDRIGAGGSILHAGPVETVIPWRWDWFDEDVRRSPPS